MEKIDKIKLAIDKGITCNPITGEVKGVRGNVITGKSHGYINIGIRDSEKIYNILAHQFIWYNVHKKCVDCIDHINGIKDDNRIENLRSVTNQQNQWNQTKAKGYSWHKNNKWQSRIRKDGKSIYLGRYDTEQEASQAYINAKQIYHI